MRYPRVLHSHQHRLQLKRLAFTRNGKPGALLSSIYCANDGIHMFTVLVSHTRGSG